MQKKLYKKIDTTLHYYEVWANHKTMCVHWGKLGETGDYKEVKLKFWQNIEKATESEIDDAQKKGFKEIDFDKLVPLIVQFKTKDEMGDENDLDKRYNVEAILNESLGWTGNGHCDGGDIGSGTINIFLFVVDPIIAIETIVKDLKSHNHENFIIAQEHGNTTTIIYPKNSKSEFRY